MRYGSIITGTPKPHGLPKTDDPLLVINTALYSIVWRIVARENPDYTYSPVGQDIARTHADDLAHGYEVGVLQIDDDTSDGVVPTASQAYGKILGVFASDHLDCVGHFSHRQSDGTEVTGWVRSGANFNSDRFELLWGRVTEFIADSAGIGPLHPEVSERDHAPPWEEVASAVAQSPAPIVNVMSVAALATSGWHSQITLERSHPIRELHCRLLWTAMKHHGFRPAFVTYRQSRK